MPNIINTILSWNYRILIFAFFFELVIAAIAVVYDPRRISSLLFNISYLSIGIGLISIFVGLAPYFSNEEKIESRAKGCFRFIMIYTVLILGFASVYYLNRVDFIPSQNDSALKDLVEKSNNFKSRVPEPPQSAKLEHEKKKHFELEKEHLDAMRFNYAMAMVKSQDPFPMYNPALAESFKDYSRIEDSLNHLNVNLISEYEAYLTAKSLAVSADTEIWKYTYFNFIYFSTVTIATVGYGDITPKTSTAKMFVTMEILSGVFLVLMYLGLVLR